MQHYCANPVQCKQKLRQCSSKSSSMVSVRSVLVFSLLLCQFDAITISFLTNRSKVNRSAASFHHSDDIHSKTHHRLVSQHEGRRFIEKLSQGMSFLHDAMNSSTNHSNANRGDFHYTGDIHLKTHDRFVSSYAADFLHENSYSSDRRFFNKPSQGISLVHEAVNSSTKTHRGVSSEDDFHDAGDLHSETHHEVSFAKDFPHEANHSNNGYFISKMSQGMSFLQSGYTHVLLGRRLHHRQKQLWGMPMMTWVIVADVFAMLVFFALILLVLNCTRTKRLSFE